MTRLIRAEVDRMLARRLFRGLLVLCVLGIFAAAIANFFTSSKDISGAIAPARQQVLACEQARERLTDARQGVQGPEPRFRCPTAEELLASFDKRFRYAEEMTATSRGLAAFGMVLAFIVGASAMGAEWGTGSMTTLLTW